MASVTIYFNELYKTTYYCLLTVVNIALIENIIIYVVGIPRLVDFVNIF